MQELHLYNSLHVGADGPQAQSLRKLGWEQSPGCCPLPTNTDSAQPPQQACWGRLASRPGPPDMLLQIPCQSEDGRHPPQASTIGPRACARSQTPPSFPQSCLQLVRVTCSLEGHAASCTRLGPPSGLGYHGGLVRQGGGREGTESGCCHSPPLLPSWQIRKEGELPLCPAAHPLSHSPVALTGLSLPAWSPELEIRPPAPPPSGFEANSYFTEHVFFCCKRRVGFDFRDKQPAAAGLSWDGVSGAGGGRDACPGVPAAVTPPCLPSPPHSPRAASWDHHLGALLALESLTRVASGDTKKTVTPGTATRRRPSRLLLPRWGPARLRRGKPARLTRSPGAGGGEAWSSGHLAWLPGRVRRSLWAALSTGRGPALPQLIQAASQEERKG